MTRCNNPEISIIVPVYNAEIYIHRCLNSLRVQSFANFEVILVDDGSIDNSGIICDEYATKDKRFKVIHQQNSGVAAARQTGKDAAQGYYIIHCDPDDWVERTWLEDLYAKTVKEEADVTICDFYTIRGLKRQRHVQKPRTLVPISVLIQMFHRLHGSLCNKLVRRACYTKYGLRFIPGINYCEDVLIWVQLLQHPEIKIAYINKTLYNYNQDNNESITRTFNPAIIKTHEAYHNILENLLPEELQYIVKQKRIQFTFFLWKNNAICIREIQDKKIFLKDILYLDMRIKEKLAYTLCYMGFEKTARMILNLRKPLSHNI